MSARAWRTYTSIRPRRLFARISSNSRLLTASQASETIETPCTMAAWNQWTAGGSETLDEFSDIAAPPARHNMHDKHHTPNTQDTQNAQDVSLTDKIDKAESIRISSRFKASATAGFQPAELRTTEFMTNWIKVIDDEHGLLSDQALNWIRATAVWWNGGARRQRAHHQHSAAPLTALQKEFVRKSGSGSRSVGRGWEGMILPGCEDPRNCADPHGVSERASEVKRCERWSV